jgi:hypothetical protein
MFNLKSESQKVKCKMYTVLYFQAVSNSVPEESCDLVPQKTCRGVYRLVPFLKPTHTCKDVPR